MFKSRSVLALGIALITMMVLLMPLASAQPAQQATVTPEPTTGVTPTVEATVAPTSTVEVTSTVEATATAVAPAVSPLATPLATPIGTPSTLPKTGASEDSAAALGLIVIAAGVLILLGAFGLAMATRRTR